MESNTSVRIKNNKKKNIFRNIYTYITTHTLPFLTNRWHFRVFILHAKYFRVNENIQFRKTRKFFRFLLFFRRRNVSYDSIQKTVQIKYQRNQILWINNFCCKKSEHVYLVHLYKVHVIELQKKKKKWPWTVSSIILL